MSLSFQRTTNAAASLAMLAAGFFASTTVQAQAPVLLVDGQRVIREAAVQADVQQKIAAVQQQMLDELKPESESLEAQRKSLQDQIGERSQEELAQDAGFVSASEDFQRKYAIFEQTTFIRSQELAATEQSAGNELQTTIRIIIGQIRRERSASIVLSAGVPIAFDESIDITDDVLARLNQQMPTMAVSRVTFTPEQRTQVLQAAAARQNEQTNRLLQQSIAQRRALNQFATQQRQRQQGEGGGQ